ncbi:MAG: dipeptide epimerase [Acidobacteria bacterium]|nr:dipeptide epimerase [Acidobacteriota bacterium]
MRIADAEFWSHDFELAEPYTIAYQTYDRATNYFVQLTDTSGLSGYGCASPAEEVTGESFSDCASALDDACLVLPGITSLEQLRGADDLESPPAATAAIEMAWLDLAARQQRIPLHAFLGAEAKPMPTSITIGISGLAETRARGADFVKRGFRALKVKGGRDVELDVARMLALREDLGVAIDLRFDANEGYDLPAAIRFLDATRVAALSVVEQPLSRDRVAEMAELRARASRAKGPRPALIADEAVLEEDDARPLVDAAAIDGAVIKLMKCGGIRAAQQIDSLASERGLRCMVSCMDEAALAIAAALSFALAAKCCVWIDLDGHLDLLNDPTTGALALSEGFLSPADGHGLGVTPKR